MSVSYLSNTIRNLRKVVSYTLPIGALLFLTYTGGACTRGTTPVVDCSTRLKNNIENRGPQTYSEKLVDFYYKVGGLSGVERNEFIESFREHNTDILYQITVEGDQTTISFTNPDSQGHVNGVTFVKKEVKFGEESGFVGVSGIIINPNGKCR